MIVAASLALGTVVAASPTPAMAQAGSSGYCPDEHGVTVVIDFQEFGGGVIVSCARGDQDTGLSALQDAGLQVEGTSRWGLAFVCRINGQPGPDRESCIDTPPATAYWSYWHSPNGGQWKYGEAGGATRKPPPGSFEGWSFSRDNAPDGNPPPGVDPVRPQAPPSESDDFDEGNADASDSDSGLGSDDGTGRSAGSTSSGSLADGRDKQERNDDDPNTVKERDDNNTGDALAPDLGGPSAPSGPSGTAELDLTMHGSSDQTGTIRAPVGTLLGLALVVSLIAAAVFTNYQRRRRA